MKTIKISAILFCSFFLLVSCDRKNVDKIINGNNDGNIFVSDDIDIVTGELLDITDPNYEENYILNLLINNRFAQEGNYGINIEGYDIVGRYDGALIVEPENQWTKIWKGRLIIHEKYGYNPKVWYVDELVSTLPDNYKNYMMKHCSGFVVQNPRVVDSVYPHPPITDVELRFTFSTTQNYAGATTPLWNSFWVFLEVKVPQTYRGQFKKIGIGYGFIFNGSPEFQNGLAIITS